MDNGIKLNVTAIFTKEQIQKVIPVLKDTNSILSIFAGRIYDCGLDAFSIMNEANQIDKILDNPNITQSDLLKVPDGDITYMGVRENIKVGIQYLEAWLRGNGCVPLYNLMEDAATAEISRAQLWQWLHNNIKIDGNEFTEDNFSSIVVDE